MTYQHCITLIDRLAHHGVRDAVICPGSRSTPLSLVAQEHPDIQTHVHIDERSAAFFALGLAKATRRPVAVITTSGTAVANLLPACIEAHQSNIPLVLLTADRPQELRDTGANQTMHQPGLFDAYTRHSVDAPHPGDGDIESVVDAAATQLLAWPPGPIHINQPLREPLAPNEEDQTLLRRLGNKTPRPTAPLTPAAPTDGFPDVLDRLRGKGLIVCGPGCTAIAPLVGLVAEALGAVVVADALSGVRFGPTPVLTGYDAYMDEPQVMGVQPDWILQLGTTPTSKALRTYLGSQTCKRYKVDASGRGWDDIPGDVTILNVDAMGWLEALAAAATPPVIDAHWHGTWRALDQAAHATADRMMADDRDVEAAWVPAILRATDRLFVGNSMPVRDLDRFGHRAIDLAVYANRGVSGIDGTIATAAGLAQTAPLLAVIGDVAFQHDVGSLALMPQDMRLVVIDNGGGRIFQHLPISQATEHFERLFLTKPRVLIATACAAFGITCITTKPSGLAAALAGDAQVIVVSTDGATSAQTRQQARALLHGDVPRILAQHS